MVSFQFDALENLGYRCFALGFFEEDVQAAFTTDCECCVTPSTVQYVTRSRKRGHFAQEFKIELLVLKGRVH